MSNDPKKKKGSWLNPVMLRWAREWRGRTYEEAAAKVDKQPHDIEKWEKGVGAPTVRQARMLAEFYGRPFLEFVFPRPPEVPEPSLIPDFRMDRGLLPPTKLRDVITVQHWVETQRVNALDLYDELGESPQEFPSDLFTTERSDPEAAASKTRSALKFTYDDQLQMRQRDVDKLPSILRQKCESIGVLTFRRNDIRDFGIRGICLAAFPLPAIVFTGEVASAQAFTISHELAHIVVKQSGITGPRSRSYVTNPIEAWADRFAAAFLMPRPLIEKFLGARPPSPRAEISDDGLNALAGASKVSSHATLIRLVHLRYVASEFYWEIKKPEFEAREAMFKSRARSKYYGSRYKSQLGDLYTGLVLEAWSSGRITNHNAAEYLGIKNLMHLRDIRENFVSG